jgi:hypothetical protein
VAALLRCVLRPAALHPCCDRTVSNELAMLRVFGWAILSTLRLA